MKLSCNKLSAIAGDKQNRRSIRCEIYGMSGFVPYCSPRIFVFTLCASFSISSAFLITSSERMFSFVLSTYCFSSVDSFTNLSVSLLSSAWRCWFAFFSMLLRMSGGIVLSFPGDVRGTFCPSCGISWLWTATRGNERSATAKKATEIMRCTVVLINYSDYMPLQQASSQNSVAIIQPLQCSCPCK